jgi:aquaporin related protein
MTQRQAMPSIDALSTSTGYTEKPVAPLPVHMQTFDGHRSDIVNHPEDRPRAHHNRGSPQYEMTSDTSYRNGPSAESGSSES